MRFRYSASDSRLRLDAPMGSSKPAAMYRLVRLCVAGPPIAASILPNGITCALRAFLVGVKPSRSNASRFR